jgi:serine/threonine-protein kinase
MFSTRRGAALVAGVGLSVLWFAGPAAADPPDGGQGVQTLLSHLSQGHTAADCQSTTPKDPEVARITCGPNHDQGGPTYAIYALFSDPADLNTDFTQTVGNGTVLPFPDGSMGPTGWHYTATASQPAGSNVILRLPDGSVNDVWTNTSTLTMAAGGSADAGAGPALYKWWLAEA